MSYHHLFMIFRDISYMHRGSQKCTNVIETFLMCITVIMQTVIFVGKLYERKLVQHVTLVPRNISG